MFFKVFVTDEFHVAEHTIGYFHQDLIKKIIEIGIEQNMLCAKGIDPQGDTIFNSLQLNVFKKEIEFFKKHPDFGKSIHFFEMLETGIANALKDDHLFLYFVYDDGQIDLTKNICPFGD